MLARGQCSARIVVERSLEIEHRTHHEANADREGIRYLAHGRLDVSEHENDSEEQAEARDRDKAEPRSARCVASRSLDVA